jgi:hypothetical protein
MLRKVGSVAVRKVAPTTANYALSPNIVEHNRSIAGCGAGFDANILLRVTLATVVLRPQVRYDLL